MNEAESIKSVIPEKPTLPDTPKKLSRLSTYHWSSTPLVTAVALVVFLCEAVEMIVIIPLYDFSPWLATLIDSSILVLVLAPALYLFLFRPLDQHLKNRERAEQALRESEMRFRTVFQTSPDAIVPGRRP